VDTPTEARTRQCGIQIRNVTILANFLDISVVIRTLGIPLPPHVKCWDISAQVAFSAASSGELWRYGR
jgi:hypothetical protein